MNDGKSEEQNSDIELECVIDELPQKVWRAISMPEFRERWLPKDALADPDATSVIPGQEVRYRMRDSAPPFFESTVTFRISPTETGGTSLRIIHELTDVRLRRTRTAAANNNNPLLMLAA